METKKLPIEIIKKLIKNDNEHYRQIAIHACLNQDVPIEIIKKGLNDDYDTIRESAIKACIGKKIPLDIIEKGMKDKYWAVRSIAIQLCIDKDVPVYILEKGLRDYYEVRNAALEICKHKRLPLNIINKWATNKDWHMRCAAMYACLNTDVPSSVIEAGLRDKIDDVRKAAMNVFISKGIKPKLIRTFDPPKKVYKKCINNVIAVAEIPKTAQIRGDKKEICRASEVIITDIIGNICGEKIGICPFSDASFYQTGDHVKIDDFDYSDDIYTSGFMFQCTLKDAKKLKV